jgi:hypothetical protein
MQREHIGSFTDEHGPPGVTVVTVNRQLSRIYLNDSEGFEQHIEPRYLAHGWNSVARLLTEHYGLPRHRLISDGFPQYYKRVPEIIDSKPTFKRKALFGQRVTRGI